MVANVFAVQNLRCIKCDIILAFKQPLSVKFHNRYQLGARIIKINYHVSEFPQAPILNSR